MPSMVDLPAPMVRRIAISALLPATTMTRVENDIHRSHQHDHQQHYRGDEFFHRQGVEQVGLLFLPGEDFEFRQIGESLLGDAPGGHCIGDFQPQFHPGARIRLKHFPGLGEMQQHDIGFRRICRNPQNRQYGKPRLPANDRSSSAASENNEASSPG